MLGQTKFWDILILESENLDDADSQIVCGGVWHNAVLCMGCWLIALLLPVLLMPAYSTGQGAVVRLASPECPDAACIPF